MNFSDALEEIGRSANTLQSCLGLFDFTPNIYFYIRDTKARFLWMNEQLQKHLGVKSIAECVGKTDSDFFSPDLVSSCYQEDMAVIASRRPLLNQLWIIPERTGRSKWFLSSKIPLFDTDSKVTVLVGIMQDLAHDFKALHPLGEMHTVIDYIVEHYYEPINSEMLASLVFLSVRQFERRFREMFQVSPREFILKVRIDAAVKLLTESDLSILQIALKCGFYDNSHFTQHFKRKMGDTPVNFRKKFS